MNSTSYSALQPYPPTIATAPSPGAFSIPQTGIPQPGMATGIPQPGVAPGIPQPAPPPYGISMPGPEAPQPELPMIPQGKII